jgi:class 3 adenylate cyclase
MIEIDHEVLCRSSIERLWPLLTDTERTNRATGLAPVVYRASDGPSAARYIGQTSLGGFDVEYEEMPTEWVHHQHFRIVRRMRSGPMTRLELTTRFTPIPQATPGEPPSLHAGGCRVGLQMRIESSSALLAPIVKMRTRQSLDRIAREVQRVDDALARNQRVTQIKAATMHEGPFTQAATALRARQPGPATGRLIQHLREADDVDLLRLRPYELADRWGEERPEVLATMLHAVRAGLLDLRWEIVCPSCRVGSEILPSLADLGDHGSCRLCELEFKLDLDEAVEATFRPSSSIRTLTEGTFCLAGPARLPHVVAQQILPPGGEARLAVPREPGRYKVFVRGGWSAPIEAAEGAADEVALRAGEEAPALRRVRPGGVVRVQHEGDDERHAKLERATWARQAATARDLTAMPAFRRDFSADVLRPGSSLKVSRVALFFSDLTGSTQLYSSVGDAAAFRLVQEHFDVVIGEIERHHGALVKTIGDAVMAVFARELDGVAASAAILRAFEVFRAGHPHREQTHIKLGLYAGPCYVVTANGVLDYFGQTVNIAARLQAQAASGELVITRELGALAEAEKVLPAAWIHERYEAQLKGVDAPIEVVRVRPG